MEKSPLGIFVTDDRGRYLEVNRAACLMSGHSETELMSLSISDFLAPQFRGEGLKLFEQIKIEGAAESDVMVRKKNGETFWINLAAASIDNDEYIAFCQDITERKDKEERAKELNCLNSFSQLLQKERNDLRKILEGTVELLHLSFKYPDDVEVSITFKGYEIKTQAYEPTAWKISARLELYGEQTGIIDVCYRLQPDHGQDPFTKEEQLMLETIAGHLSRVTEQYHVEEELKRSKDLFAITLDSIGDGVIATDIEGKITRLNPQAEILTGWTTEEALGRDLREVFHIVNAETGEPSINPVYQVIDTKKVQKLDNDTMLIARTGIKRYIADSAAPILDAENAMVGVIMVFSDVTERKRAETSLKYQFLFEKMLADISNNFASQPSNESEESIKYALAQVGGFFQVDRSYVFSFSEDGKKVSSVFEWCAEGITTQMSIAQGLPLAHLPWLTEQLLHKKHVNIPDVDSLPTEAELEKNIFKSQGIHSLLYIPLIKNGNVSGFFGLEALRVKTIWEENQVILLKVVAELISNALIRISVEERVRYQSFHDGLTSLYNRVYLEEEMERLDTERQLPAGIIMADLNGLKLVNDTFGHAAGDEMLKHTAKILKSSCRKEDICARWGGDEFVIFLPQTTEENAKAICQRINLKCEGTNIEGIRLSLALGTAIRYSINQNMNDLLKEAEENMYKNKRAERSRE